MRTDCLTYSSWPQTRDRKTMSFFTLEVHCKAHSQGRHAPLAHGVRCLPSQKPAVDGRADHDEPTLASVCSARVVVEVRQDGLNGCIQTLGVDALHELEPFHGRFRYTGPPNCAAVVNDRIKMSIMLHDGIHCFLDLFREAHVQLYRESEATCFLYLPSYGVDRRLG